MVTDPMLALPDMSKPLEGLLLAADVETYVRICLICQQDKADHQKKAGLLQPLPIPTRPWESVSMDYISGLPKVGDLGSIIVVVDRLSKYATFIAAPKHVTAEGTAQILGPAQGYRQ
ncbi:UNVERIFIED_CONTAM: Transposon Tf2-11 polyprotein [Sesamum radiatum]|uniref:Transposon Tf2-11 polyprotein n=1 Tax=Sesamum radiatum TaxID=300843 RepID=A0AAW2RFD9_SESRA